MMRESVEAWIKIMGTGEAHANTLRLFLLIASYGDRPVPQLALRDLSGLSEAAVSRNLASLSLGKNPLQRGPELVESFEDPAYPRRKLVKLTTSGRRFVETLDGIVVKHSKGVPA